MLDILESVECYKNNKSMNSDDDPLPNSILYTLEHQHGQYSQVLLREGRQVKPPNREICYYIRSVICKLG